MGNAKIEDLKKKKKKKSKDEEDEEVAEKKTDEEEEAISDEDLDGVAGGTLRRGTLRPGGIQDAERLDIRPGRIGSVFSPRA